MLVVGLRPQQRTGGIELGRHPVEVPAARLRDAGGDQVAVAIHRRPRGVGPERVGAAPEFVEGRVVLDHQPLQRAGGVGHAAHEEELAGGPDRDVHRRGGGRDRLGPQRVAGRVVGHREHVAPGAAGDDQVACGRERHRGRGIDRQVVQAEAALPQPRAIRPVLDRDDVVRGAPAGIGRPCAPQHIGIAGGIGDHPRAIGERRGDHVLPQQVAIGVDLQHDDAVGVVAGVHQPARDDGVTQAIHRHPVGRLARTGVVEAALPQLGAGAAGLAQLDRQRQRIAGGHERVVGTIQCEHRAIGVGRAPAPGLRQRGQRPQAHGQHGQRGAPRAA